MYSSYTSGVVEAGLLDAWPSSPWLSRKLFSSRLGLLFSLLTKYLDGENLANSWSFSKFAKF